jgi:hypothetical protein
LCLPSIGIPNARIVGTFNAGPQTRDGLLIWTLRLDAIDTVRQTKETIWVEVAGDEPKLTFDGFADVRGLVFAPWVGKDGKIKRAFRAEAVASAQSGKPAVHAA